MVTNLGYKIFITYATINILGGCVFSLLIPETKQKTLEELSNETQDNFVNGVAGTSTVLPTTLEHKQPDDSSA